MVCLLLSTATLSSNVACFSLLLQLSVYEARALPRYHQCVLVLSWKIKSWVCYKRNCLRFRRHEVAYSSVSFSVWSAGFGRQDSCTLCCSFAQSLAVVLQVFVSFGRKGAPGKGLCLVTNKNIDCAIISLYHRLSASSLDNILTCWRILLLSWIMADCVNYKLSSGEY